MKTVQDIHYAIGLFVILLAAYIFVTDLTKVKVIETMLIGSFGAALMAIQAKVRHHTDTGDIVNTKIERAAEPKEPK